MKTKRIMILLAIAIVVAVSSYLLSISELIFNITLNVILLSLLSHLVILQGLEVQRIRDGLTWQRWGWLVLFLVGCFSLVPIIMSQYLKLIGEPSDFLIALSTVLSPIQRATMVGMLYWLYRSRIKEL